MVDDRHVELRQGEAVEHQPDDQLCEPSGQAPGPELLERANAVAGEILTRSPLAIGALKAAFSARHNGVSGQARMAHDQQLTLYLATKEAHETSRAFGERRTPDPDTFWN